MIDRILKTYGEVNTTVKHFPPENINIILLKFYNLGKICILHGHVCIDLEYHLLKNILFKTEDDV